MAWPLQTTSPMGVCAMIESGNGAKPTLLPPDHTLAARAPLEGSSPGPQRQLPERLRLGPIVAAGREGTKAERGVATVEMAFVLPILLALVLGTTTLGHAVITRFLMHSAAYDAARTCALGRAFTSACVTNVVNEKLKDMTKWCSNGIRAASVTDQSVQGLEGVNVLAVRLQCDFVGGVGTTYLKQHGLSITVINAYAAMPH